MSGKRKCVLCTVGVVVLNLNGGGGGGNTDTELNFPGEGRPCRVRKEFLCQVYSS